MEQGEKEVTQAPVEESKGPQSRDDFIDIQDLVAKMTEAGEIGSPEESETHGAPEETPDVTEPTETPEEAPAAPEDAPETKSNELESEKWAELLDSQRRDRARLSELEKKAKDYELTVKEKSEVIDLLQKDPIKALNKLGLDWQEFLNRGMEGSTEEATKSRQEDEQKTTIQQLQEQLQQLQQTVQQRNALDYARGMITNNADRWPHLAKNARGAEALFAAYQEEYSRTGQLPSEESVADALEKRIEEHSLFEEWKKSRGQPQASATPAQPPSTASLASPPATTPPSTQQAAASTGDLWESMRKRLGRDPTNSEVIAQIMKGG